MAEPAVPYSSETSAMPCPPSSFSTPRPPPEIISIFFGVMRMPVSPPGMPRSPMDITVSVLAAELSIAIFVHVTFPALSTVKVYVPLSAPMRNPPFKIVTPSASSTIFILSTARRNPVRSCSSSEAAPSASSIRDSSLPFAAVNVC